MADKQKIIMYVDDDEDDRELLTDAIQQTNPEVEVILTTDGLEALQYLVTQKSAGARLPSLVVLDLNMPLLDGKATLEGLRADPVLRELPVIIFSSSERPADRIFFNELGIDYFIKPTSLPEIADIVNHMVNACC
jgi:CheY-like chemotaxis protein